MESIASLCGVKAITLDTVKQLLISEMNHSQAIITAISNVQRQWMQIVTELLPATVFFYIVIATSKQRFMKAFAGVVVCNILLGMTSEIYTATVMINHLIETDGHTSEPVLTGLIIECVKKALYAWVLISPLLSVIGLYLAWRKIKRFQI